MCHNKSLLPGNREQRHPQDSFVKRGGYEAQMVGQGLGRSIETVLEWSVDLPTVRSVSSIICNTLEVSSKEEQTINRS